MAIGSIVGVVSLILGLVAMHDSLLAPALRERVRVDRIEDLDRALQSHSLRPHEGSATSSEVDWIRGQLQRLEARLERLARPPAAR